MNITAMQGKPQPTGLTPTTPKPKARRMSLAAATSGIVVEPFRILLYGEEKLGKSTFAAGAPGAIWLGADKGTGHLNVRRMPEPETWADVLDALAELEENGAAHGVKTIVIDPLGWFEAILVRGIIPNGGSLAKWGGGHGAGYQEMTTRWRQFMAAVERCWLRGMNILFIAHSAVKMFHDPLGPEFERYEVAADKRLVGPVKQWVQHILFVKQEVFVRSDEKTKRTKAFGDGARYIYTQNSPAFDAGNRASLPARLPLSWHEFEAALANGSRQHDALKAQIEAGLVELGDEMLALKVREGLAQGFDIAEIANAVSAKLEEKRQADAEQTNDTDTDTDNAAAEQQGE
jgi:hypothetical protein